MQKVLFILLLFIGNGSFSQMNIDSLKINQIQTLGSHNSYHKRPNKFMLNFLKGLKSLFPKDANPCDLDYAHEPLVTQLDSFHLRSFEIDIYADPKGGHYYKRIKNNLLGKPKSSKNADLKNSGFKVLHIPDVDYNTHYSSFKSMLEDFKKWSDVHPNHLPIYLLIECKEECIADRISKLHFTKTIPFTPSLCDDLDKEVKAVFGDSLNKIITPDAVRGRYGSLREAVLNHNFPTIAAARGKFIFILMGATDAYKQNYPNLKGRAMFTFASEYDAEAAFIKCDNPIGNESSIQELVRKGFIIRTRADSPNNQNRTGDYTQQKAAFISGAQIISSDYYRPDIRYKKKPKKFKNYSCKLPVQGVGICNPVLIQQEKTETITE